MPQTVTVTGVDDPLIDGTQTVAINLSIDQANSDDDFDSIAAQTVSVDNADNDAAGFAVTETGGDTRVNEAGSTDSFTVVLDAQPDVNVVIIVQGSNNSEAIVAPAALIFTPANWNVGQAVTVTGVDDDRDDGDQTVTVTLAVDDANSDDNFDPLANQTVSSTTVDDDVVGFVIV